MSCALPASAALYPLKMHEPGKTPVCCAAGAAAAESQLDCKASAGQLHPVQEVKVSHGDDNLALSDFLAKIGADIS